MGWMHAEDIEAAARYLLKILTARGKVPYSEFYDGTEETQLRLAAGLGVPPKDAEGFGAEGIMDQAAAVLEDEGYVKITWLDEELADGEPAYEIDLLPEGRAMLAAGKLPVFRDLDL